MTLFIVMVECVSNNLENFVQSSETENEHFPPLLIAAGDNAATPLIPDVDSQDAKDSQQPGDEVEKPPKKRRQADNERIKRKNERKQELEAEKQRNAKLEMLLLDESALHKGTRLGATPCTISQTSFVELIR